MRKIIDVTTIKRTLIDWGKVLLLLLDEAVVIVLAIVVLHFFKITIPLPVMIVLALTLGAFIFFIHVAVISSFHRKQATGQEGMMGEQGRVIEPLTPVGTVMVEGEHWKAESVDGDIEIDENVEIVGIERLKLKVKRKSS